MPNNQIIVELDDADIVLQECQKCREYIYVYDLDCMGLCEYCSMYTDTGVID